MNIKILSCNITAKFKSLEIHPSSPRTRQKASGNKCRLNIIVTCYNEIRFKKLNDHMST